MTKPINRLSDMEYDEVSLVGLACNQAADIVLFKSAPAPFVSITRRSSSGKTALARHAIRKSYGPTPSDVHEDAPMKGKKKRKKKIPTDPMEDLEKSLTPEEKERAKGRAKAAGRRYPNAYDNLYESRKKRKKKTDGEPEIEVSAS